MCNYAPGSGVASSTHESGLTLLHVGEGRMFVANRTGAYAWEGLERGLTAGTIAEEISRHYQIPLATALADTAQFFAALERHQLIKAR